MNTIGHMEFGPFGQPQPNDNGENFERYFRRLSGGSTGTPDAIRDAALYPKILALMMELVSEKPYGRALPILKGDVEGYYSKEDATLYIDALVNARRAYFREDQRKGRGAIPTEKPGFFVHSYAVRHLPADSKNTEQLNSPADIGGYMVTAGTNDRPHAFFVQTTDRSVVKSIHEKIVEECSSGEKPKDPEATVTDFFREHSYRNLFEHGGITSIIWIGQIGGRAAPLPAERDGDEALSEAKPISRSLYRDSIEDARDYAKLPLITEHDGKIAHSLTLGFHGYLESDRSGHTTPKFIDEVVSSFPGGVFVYTRAIGIPGREREALGSRADVGAYMISVGLRGGQKTAQIHTRHRSLAHEIHLRVLAELQQGSDIHGNQKKSEDVLREIADEFKAPYDENKIVFIEIKE